MPPGSWITGPRHTGHCVCSTRVARFMSRLVRPACNWDALSSNQQESAIKWIFRIGLSDVAILLDVVQYASDHVTSCCT